VGWVRGGETFIAEVRSLNVENEGRRIRMGVRRARRQMREIEDAGTVWALHAALVLDERPADTEWRLRAEAKGVLLTWAPEFPGC
jgi:hypothetical protein